MKNWVEDKIAEINETKIWDKVIEEYNKQKSENSVEEFNVGKFFDFFHKSIFPFFSCAKSECNLISKVNIYKELLLRIKKADKCGYIDIHKGAPFFFIGWYSFFLSNYDNAIFYLDAALAEDKKNMKKDTTIIDGIKIYGWKDSGAALFFLLKSEYVGIYHEFSTIKLKTLLRKMLNDFCSISSKNINLNDFRDKFISNLLENTNNTAIITTLYSFILEKEAVSEMIILKGSNSGTIEPIILHLSKGTLIIESLLKMNYTIITIYEENSNLRNTRTRIKTKKITLGELLNSKEFNDKYFSVKEPSREKYSVSDLNLISEKPIFGNISNMSNNFTIAAMVRNTSAHSINWDDKFIKDYEVMYKHIIYAIFFIIDKEYDL